MMYVFRMNSTNRHLLIVGSLLYGLSSVRVGAQIIPPVVLQPPTVTSGTPNANLIQQLGLPTGFSYTGNLYWQNVQTLGATLTMDMVGTLDPNYTPQPMQLGATMSGTFDVPGTGLGPQVPPDFVINYFSLTTSIPNSPYPVASAVVNGPFHGGHPGLTNQPYSASAATSSFFYTPSPSYPQILLRFVMNVDGMSIPGQFRIDFPASASFTQVPEPGMLLMTGLGAVGLVFGRQSRRYRRRPNAVVPST